MSFYDDLNKFVHNYPYTNYHEVVLDFLTKLTNELKKIVEDADLEHLPERLEAIEAQLDRDAGKIAVLESFSATASEAIQSLRAITTAHTADLEAIHNEIDGVIDQLTLSITQLTNNFNEYKTVTDGRLEVLEGVAFDPSQIVMSNMPFNFALSMLDANKYGVRIVADEAVSAQDSIQWVDGGQYAPSNIPVKQKFNSTFKLPRFYSSGNACHLVIPSVFPIKYGASINWNLYFYANRWIGATNANTGIVKVGSIAFTQLLSDGGYTLPAGTNPSANTTCFNDMELFPNQETGCYDLYIYNGRNGHYTWINDYIPSSIMILPLDLGTMSQTASIQRYFNLLNTFMIQSSSNVDGKIAGIESTCNSYTNSAVNAEATARNSQVTFVANTLARDITPLAESFVAGENVTLVRNKCYMRSCQWDSDTYVYNTDIYYVELTVDISNLPHNTDVAIGSFAGMSLASNHNINCDIQKPNSGCYASVASNGVVTIHAYNPSGSDFGDSSRVHLMGVIIDQTIT